MTISDEQRKCPYCGMAMAQDQRACPDCGNPYPFDDEAPAPADPSPPRRAGREGRPPLATDDFGAGPAAVGGGPRPPGGAGGAAGAGGSAGGAMALITQYKTILVLVGVLILIVAVGYALFRFGMSFFEANRPDPSSLSTTTTGPVVAQPPIGAPGSPVPGASPSPGAGGTVISPAASPSPSPQAAGSGVKLKVANTEGQGANMRQRPSTTAPVVRTLAEGAVVEAIGDPSSAEGRTWRNVRDQGGATGWVAADLLVPE